MTFFDEPVESQSRRLIKAIVLTSSAILRLRSGQARDLIIRHTERIRSVGFTINSENLVEFKTLPLIYTLRE